MAMQEDDELFMPGEDETGYYDGDEEGEEGPTTGEMSNEEYLDRMATALKSMSLGRKEQHPHTNTSTAFLYQSRNRTTDDVLDLIEYFNSSRMVKESVARLYPGGASEPKPEARRFLVRGTTLKAKMRRARQQRVAWEREKESRSASPTPCRSRSMLTEQQLEERRHALYQNPFSTKTAPFIIEKVRKEHLNADNYGTYKHLKQVSSLKDVLPREEELKPPGGPWRRRSWKPAGPLSTRAREEEVDKAVVKGSKREPTLNLQKVGYDEEQIPTFLTKSAAKHQEASRALKKKLEKEAEEREKRPSWNY